MSFELTDDILDDVKLTDKISSILLPEGYYRMKIPNEQRHYYKNKGFIRGYTNNSISNFTLGDEEHLYTSSAIELQPNDIIQVIIPKTFIERAYEHYKQYQSVNKNLISQVTFSDKPRIDDNGKFDTTNLPPWGSFGFLTSEGSLSPYTTEMKLPVVYKNSEFLDLNFYVYTREITQNIYDNYSKYIYLTDWLSNNPRTHYIDEQNRIYNCGILRKGKDPYDNWQEQQNNLAFKHYLYQSHIRKEK